MNTPDIATLDIAGFKIGQNTYIIKPYYKYEKCYLCGSNTSKINNYQTNSVIIYKISLCSEGIYFTDINNDDFSFASLFSSEQEAIVKCQKLNKFGKTNNCNEPIVPIGLLGFDINKYIYCLLPIEMDIRCDACEGKGSIIITKKNRAYEYYCAECVASGFQKHIQEYKIIKHKLVHIELSDENIFLTVTENFEHDLTFGINDCFLSKKEAIIECVKRNAKLKATNSEV